MRSVIAIVIISAITIIAYTRMGVIGEFLSNLQRFLFGKLYVLIMVIIVAQIIMNIITRSSEKKGDEPFHFPPIAAVLIIIAILLGSAYANTSHNLKGYDIFSNFINDPMMYFTDPNVNVAGGFLGAILLSITTFLVDYPGTILIIVVLGIITTLLFGLLPSYKNAFKRIWDYFSTVSIAEIVEDEEEEEESSTLPIIQQKVVEPVKGMEPVSNPVQGSIVEIPKKEIAPTLSEDTLANLQLATGVHNIELEKYQFENQKNPLDIKVDEDVQHDDLELMKDMPIRESEEGNQQHTVFLNVDDIKQEDEKNEFIIEEKPSVSQPRLKLEVVEEEDAYSEENRPNGSSEEDEHFYGNEEVKTTKKLRSKKYILPNKELLDPIPSISRDDLNIKAAETKGVQLIEVLQNFDIQAELLETHIGPSVTKFEVRPEVGVKVSKILGLADDIKMQLAVKDVRIEAPIPGHNAVGIEIPNVKSVPVKMKELIGTVPSRDNHPLLIYMGKDLLGQTVTCRLDKMPHLLIAGATGSGKSVCMNAIITSLLFRAKPEEVKMLLIDPKKVEFTPFKKIPHLIGPVVDDALKASNALKVVVKEMEDRYDIFSRSGVRNMQAYNEAVEKGYITREDAEGNEYPADKLPYIVVIIDELADLMMVAGKEVESSIQRITQLARAAGIHLIVATQRPSTDVITGIIKANIPSRIAFSVSSGIDSRTILDHVGAERLLGNGDMLYMPIGESNALRVQGVFVTDDEVRKITEYCSNQAVPVYYDAFVDLAAVYRGGENGSATSEDDPLSEEIKNYVIEAQKASTSLLQRKFGIGYNRAARMIDILESEGIIGPAQGSKPREVYIKKDTE
ncbi:MAG: DNA translocase FtsK [Solobacterium sp.]|nr:DNA translocase FtsK [Solobacterium sp.]